MKRLIVPPLPAASRPSKTMTRRSPVSLTQLCSFSSSICCSRLCPLVLRALHALRRTGSSPARCRPGCRPAGPARGRRGRCSRPAGPSSRARVTASGSAHRRSHACPRPVRGCGTDQDRSQQRQRNARARTTAKQTPAAARPSRPAPVRRGRAGRALALRPGSPDQPRAKTATTATVTPKLTAADLAECGPVDAHMALPVGALRRLGQDARRRRRCAEGDLVASLTLCGVHGVAAGEHDDGRGAARRRPGPPPSMPAVPPCVTALAATPPPTTAAAGSVTSQASAIRPATLQRTSASRACRRRRRGCSRRRPGWWTAAKPRCAEREDDGRGRRVSAAKPCGDWMSVRPLPMVRMIRQPPR